VSERDSKRIVRRWNREIEAELRQEAATRAAAKGPWRRVVWIALWVLWLGIVVALLTRVSALR